MAKLALLTGDGQTLSLDTDDPGTSAQTLQTYVNGERAKAKTEVQASLDAVSSERDALKTALVDQVADLKRTRLGAENFDAEATAAHLASLTGAQLSFALAEEQKLAKATPATPAPTPTGAQTDPNQRPDDAASLAAGGPPSFLSPSRVKRAAATVAVLAVALLGFAAPATATAATTAPQIEAGDSAPTEAFGGVAFENQTDAQRAQIAADDQARFASETATIEAASDDSDAADILAILSGFAALVASLGFGATIFGTNASGVGLRAFIGDCRAITITAPAQGLTAGVPVAIGDQYGLPITDAAEGVAVSCVTETTDAGFSGAKAGVAFGAGDTVYWDADGSPVGGVALSGAFTNTDDTGANAKMGFALDPAGAGDATVRFQKTLI